jgi:hypothetical protein
MFAGGVSFAFFSPPQDGSFRLVLPERWSTKALAEGWGKRREGGDALWLYGPRDGDELEVLTFLIRQAAKEARAKAQGGLPANESQK